MRINYHSYFCHVVCEFDSSILHSVSERLPCRGWWLPLFCISIYYYYSVTHLCTRTAALLAHLILRVRFNFCADFGYINSNWTHSVAVKLVGRFNRFTDFECRYMGRWWADRPQNWRRKLCARKEIERFCWWVTTVNPYPIRHDTNQSVSFTPFIAKEMARTRWT